MPLVRVRLLRQVLARGFLGADFRYCASGVKIRAYALGI